MVDIVASLAALADPAALPATIQSLWPDAAARPDELVAVADALDRRGRLDLAEAVLALAELSTGDSIRLLIRFAEIPFKQTEWPIAVRRALRVRDRAPDQSYGFVQTGVALREAGDLAAADAALAEAVERFPLDEGAQSHFTDLARRLQAWPELAQRARRFSEQFPRNPFGPVMLAVALRESGDLDEADIVVGRAVLTFAGDAGVMGLWIDIGLRRKAWPDVVARCALARERFGDFYPAYVEAGVAMRESGDLAAADRIFQATCERFPREMGCNIHWVNAAIRGNDLAEADRRAAIFIDRFPDQAYPVMLRVQVLHNSRRDQEAEALLAAAAIKFPNDTTILFHAADAALRAGNWAEAQRRGERLRAMAPADLGGALIVATALRETGRVQESLDILTPFSEGPKADLRVMWFIADGLTRLHRLPEAGACLDSALRMYPDDWHLLMRRVELGMNMGDEAGSMAAWHAAAARPGVDGGAVLDLSWSIFAQATGPDTVHALLHVLCQERDNGARNWLPRLAKLERLLGARPELREMARQFVATADSGALDRTTFLLLKTYLGFELSDEEILAYFTIFAQAGRSGVVAHLFSLPYCERQPDGQARVARLFDTWLAAKLRDPLWIAETSAAGLLVCLSLAAIFSRQSYCHLVEAGRSRLDLAAMDRGDRWTTPESCVASIVTQAALAEPDLPIPSVGAAERRLKIAVCVSGQLRGFREAWPSWRNFGFDAHDARLFVHSWTDIGRNWTRFWSFTQYDRVLWERLVEKDCLTLLQPRFPRTAAALSARGQVTEDELRAFYGTEHVCLEDDRRPPLSETSTPWKMHNKIERAYDLAMATGEEFDLIVRIRPDREVLADSRPDWHAVLEKSRTERTIFSDRSLSYGDGRMSMGDQFAVGSQRIMALYSTIFSQTEGYAQSGKIPLDLHGHLDNHRSMAYCIFYNGIGSEVVPHLGFGNLLDPVALSPREILPLVREDMASRPSDAFDERFLAAFERLG